MLHSRNIGRAFPLSLAPQTFLNFICTHNDVKNTALRNCQTSENETNKAKGPRYNPINIQMLSSSLHNQIFGTKPGVSCDAQSLAKVISHLSKHNLWQAKTSTLSDVDFKLPPLHHDDIIDHFHHIATELLKDYKALLLDFVKCELPPIPQHWKMHPGWMRYEGGKEPESVDFPEEGALVLDLEVCMQEGNFPTIATAVSKKCWYLWCSEKLTEDHFEWSKNVTLSDLIPLETSKDQVKPPNGTNWIPRIIIGHNVAFDRTFIKEQYFLEKTKTTFLDTMSLHICVSGLTGMQRAMSLAGKKKTPENGSVPNPSIGWSYMSSLNNLADVYNLYCGGEVNKAERELFVSGSLLDVKEKFQDAATYCALDSKATFEIFQKILPMYLERFPHPVTLYGLLEMSTAYLPVNQNWERYLHEAQSTYDDLQKELKLSLVHIANDACSLLQNDLYKKDPWLWDLDWSVQNIKFRKEVKKSVKGKARKRDENQLKKNEEALNQSSENEDLCDVEVEMDKPIAIDSSLKEMYGTSASLRKVRPFLPGYPAWYRLLCDSKTTYEADWEPGPYLISTQMRCVPKLMRMTWDGYPLHYDSKHGWGFLVPTAGKATFSETDAFPLRNLMELLKFKSKGNKSNEMAMDLLWLTIQEPKESSYETNQLWKSILEKQEEDNVDHATKFQLSSGPHDIGVDGLHFYRLPHKDGPHKRVGNPLSKDFLSKIEDNILQTWGQEQAERALVLSKMLSYWKNAHSRIGSQMVVWLNNDEISETVKCSGNYDENGLNGAILPRLVPAGTVTRRAVEPTWLTASNAYEDRVGSELKTMIQAPSGYHFVGADVDSQELWLAAIFGDSQFVKLHGCTAFGWMTLQGKKSSGTDMHSKTAASVGTTRDQAKILNYARIYGAGKSFAQRLLMQFNHSLSLEEAKSKVNKIYSETKGVQKYVVADDEIEDNGFIFTTGGQKRIWINGSESHMFNKLEEIALSQKPCTPALECRISRALEPKAVDKNFMTSRINWVVQSSAVDFLHLMLVCMKWLCNEFNIEGRFSISIHDEVRYLVKSEDRYRAALALQITNLLTRSFFTAKLGMNDLPQVVCSILQCGRY